MPPEGGREHMSMRGDLLLSGVGRIAGRDKEKKNVEFYGAIMAVCADGQEQRFHH